MHKVLPCIVQVRRYSFIKKNHRLYDKISVLPSFRDAIFVIKYILSEAELRAD